MSARLGHAKVSMTLDIYAHLLPAMDDQAVDAISDLLDGPETDPGDGCGTDGQPPF